MIETYTYDFCFNGVNQWDYLVQVLFEYQLDCHSSVADASLQFIWVGVAAVAGRTSIWASIAGWAFRWTSKASSCVLVEVVASVASQAIYSGETSSTGSRALHAAGQSRQIIVWIALAAGALVLESAPGTVFNWRSASDACWSASIPNSCIWALVHDAGGSVCQGTCDCTCVVIL